MKYCPEIDMEIVAIALNGAYLHSNVNIELENIINVGDFNTKALASDRN